MFKKIIIIITSLLFMNVACADHNLIRCVGMNNDGSEWNVFVDLNNQKIIVNSAILKIEELKRTGSDKYIVVHTEDYIGDRTGEQIYSSVVFGIKGDERGKTYFLQRNAVTKELRKPIELICK